MVLHQLLKALASDGKLGLFRDLLGKMLVLPPSKRLSVGFMGGDLMAF